jgi:hypothetical protein
VEPVIPVNQKSSSPVHTPIPAWQRLGELALRPSADADDAVHRWLISTFAPLDLPAGFIARVLRSAQDVVERALAPDTNAEAPPLHVIMFAPLQCQVPSPCWGFFRIEKIGQPEPGIDAGHVIELYLYLEENQAKGERAGVLPV